MSEPAAFILIRGGEQRLFGDRWASVSLFAQLLWGPDDFEQWATQQHEVDEFDGDFSGGVVANYDTKRLVWCGDSEPLNVPRRQEVHAQLLSAAWPGFEIEYANKGMLDLADAAGIKLSLLTDDDEPDDVFGYRHETIVDAARSDDDDEDYDDEDEEDDDEGPFYSEEPRAWVTLVSDDRSVRHYYLEELSSDLLLDSRSIAKFADLEPAEVPAEAVVSEGMWIDASNKTIGLWGNRELHEGLSRVEQAWSGWSVEYRFSGYVRQCEVSGPTGVPLTDATALAGILPAVLSTERFDLSTMISALGGGLKRFAMKATGCLLIVICIPLLIVGAITGEWTTVLILCGVIVAATIGVFKYIEYRMKRKIATSIPTGQHEENEAPPVAGPLEERARRARLDQLLAAAGMPKLAEVEPLFDAEEYD